MLEQGVQSWNEMIMARESSLGETKFTVVWTSVNPTAFRTCMLKFYHEGTSQIH